MSIPRLIDLLSREVDRPIIDKTNLTGTYDVSLKFSSSEAFNVAAVTERTVDPQASPNVPSIFTALQEQLGLKLESSKGPVEVLVIDSVSKPTEN